MHHTRSPVLQRLKKTRADTPPNRGHPRHHGDRHDRRRRQAPQRVGAGHQPPHEIHRGHARRAPVQPAARALCADAGGAQHLRSPGRHLPQGGGPAVRHRPARQGRGARAELRLGAEHRQRHGAARRGEAAAAVPQPRHRHQHPEDRGGDRLSAAGARRGRGHQLALRPRDHRFRAARRRAALLHRGASTASWRRGPRSAPTRSSRIR